VGVPAAGAGLRPRDELLAGLRDWHEAGVWQRLHESLLAELNAAGKLDLPKAMIDGSHIRAINGGPKPVRVRLTAPGVEQGFALPHWFRRLRIRWEIRDDIHEAFLSFACGISGGPDWPAHYLVRTF
jgi:hypothetical protein